jgi:hypothetical protein
MATRLDLTKSFNTAFRMFSLIICLIASLGAVSDMGMLMAFSQL